MLTHIHTYISNDETKPSRSRPCPLITPQIIFQHHGNISHSLAPGNHSSAFSHYKFVCICEVNSITQSRFCFAWFLSLITISNSYQGMCQQFFFYCGVIMYSPNWFTHLHADRLLLFPCWVIINKVAMNIYIQVSL